MRFLEYKCEDCGEISEIIVMVDDDGPIKCEKCDSTKMVRVFAPVGFKNNSGDPSSAASSNSCSGSCANCSGCK